MKVVNTQVRKYQNGSLVGFASVGVSLDDSDEAHVTINDIRLFKNDRGSWLGMPSKEYKDRDGNQKWQDTVAISRAKQDEPKTAGDKFYNMLLEAIRKEYNSPTPAQKQTPPKQESYASNTGDLSDDGIPF